VGGVGEIAALVSAEFPPSGALTGQERHTTIGPYPFVQPCQSAARSRRLFMASLTSRMVPESGWHL
jgi:hypothetical protein